MNEIVRKLMLLHGGADGGVLESVRCDRCIAYMPTILGEHRCVHPKNVEAIRIRADGAADVSYCPPPEHGCALFEAKP